METLYVRLPSWAVEALHRQADANQRTQREQAAHLIITALVRADRRAARTTRAKTGNGDGR